jgi:hypothetical protein
MSKQVGDYFWMKIKEIYQSTMSRRVAKVFVDR